MRSASGNGFKVPIGDIYDKEQISISMTLLVRLPEVSGRTPGGHNLGSMTFSVPGAGPNALRHPGPSISMLIETIRCLCYAQT